MCGSSTDTGIVHPGRHSGTDRGSRGSGTPLGGEGDQLTRASPEFRNRASHHRPSHGVTALGQDSDAAGLGFLGAGAAGEADEILVELEPDPVIAVDPG